MKLFKCRGGIVLGKIASEHHPILFIECLLKEGKGDEGRLLYLRKALTNGKTIYKSDKKYLEKLQSGLNKSLGSPDRVIYSELSFSNYPKGNLNSQKDSFKLIGSSSFDKNTDRIESDIESNQVLIDDLKRKDSKIKDNLELLLINREISIPQPIEKSHSVRLFSCFKKFLI